MAYTAGADIPAHLVTTIFEQTEGNPFFVTEITRLLVVEGSIDRPNANAWRPATPETVREVINRRLDRLSSTCNRILTLASVIGREFAFGALERASGLSGERLLVVLAEAETARVIMQTPGPMGRCRFTHALIRDTLYEQLPAALRTQLHQRAGQAL
jgi:predicted ATPase